MSKFKVGDKVKSVLENGIVVNIKDEDKYLVKIIGLNGHGGFSSEYKNVDGENDKWWFYEHELELIDNDLIKSILFNNPYTTVLFNDGTKSIVKCHVNDEFDEYQGFVNAVAKHTLQMNGLEIAELIESKAKRKYPKQINDDVIRVGDKVIHEDEEYFVCSIDKTVDNYPYNLSIFKEDIGKSFYELRNNGKRTEWNIAHINEITKVKSK